MRTPTSARVVSVLSAVSALSGLTACGGGSGPGGYPATEVAPAEPSARYTPPSPVDEAKRVLAEALETDEPKERCAKLQEAVALDGSLYDAHIVRAESRCAAAADLLDDARVSLTMRLDARSANALVAVAVRAESVPDAIKGAEALLEATTDEDIDALRLAARTLSHAGKHARAAKVFEQIATVRAAKAAPLDALDAQLDAVLEHARAKSAGGPTAVDPGKALLDTIAASATQIAGYGAAWLGPKIVEAIAALRTSGDPDAAEAASKRVRETKGLATADVVAALDLERAIAAMRTQAEGPAIPAKSARPSVAGARSDSKRAALTAGERLAPRATSTISRAYLAVESKLAGACARARSYANAYAQLPRDAIPRLDEDVAWASECPGGEALPSLLAPPVSAAIDDARGVATVDRTRARAMLQRTLERAPTDPSSYLALAAMVPPDEAAATLDLGLGRLPTALSLHLRRFEALEAGSARDAEGTQIVSTLVGGTLEVEDDPRAAAPIFARMLLAWGAAPTNAFEESLATALLRACESASPRAASCVDPPQLEAISVASTLLRERAPESLAKWGPSLANADLTPRARLDVVLALVGLKQLPRAQLLAGGTRGGWDGAEEALAYASMAAAEKLCVAAKRGLAKASGLPTSYDAVAAAIAEKCGK